MPTPGDVHRPGVSVWSEDVSNEDDTEIIPSGQITDRRVGNMEHDVVAEGVRAAGAARGTSDPEREVAGAIPIESPGVCYQELAGNGLIDRNIGQGDSNPVEFEGLEVCRTRLGE